MSSIRDYLEKNKTTLSKIFKDFNNSEMGKLKFGEFNSMLRYM
jgi:hypothetical protein